MKYKIQGNFDFYSELYKSLDEDEKNISSNTDTCLITNLPLEDNFVTLECKHKFNYDPLYKEIYNQKCKLLLYGIQHLSPNMRDVYVKSGKDYFIKCPYCRNIQFELLPDLNKDIYPKVYGINTNDRSYTRTPDSNSKGYIHKGYFYNVSNSNINNCSHKGCKSTICAFNDQFKMFCCSVHMSSEIKRNKLELKVQNDKKLQEEKAKIKEEKAKIKEEKVKNKKVEPVKEDKAPKNKKMINNVISTNNQINEYVPPNQDQDQDQDQDKQAIYCSAVLKSGNKKGQLCRLSAFSEGLCKRHFKLKLPTKNVGNSLELVDLDEFIEKSII